MFRDLKENACYDNADLYRLVRYSIRRIKDEEIDELLKKARSRDNYFILGYYEEGSLVGLMLYRIEGDSAFLEVISVEKDERGKGIGTTMLRELRDRYRNLRLVADCDAVAAPFYKKLGFSVQSLGRNYYEEESFRCSIDYRDD